MSLHAIFPGSFDPPTLGHLDVIHRGAALFERLTLAVAVHPDKRFLFDVDERVELLERCVAGYGGIEVIPLGGLLVDGCRKVGATVVLRGVRSMSDFDYEIGMARTNRAMAPDIETVLLAPSGGVSHISSTLVRQIAQMGGDVSDFVPHPVLEALRRKFPG